MYGNARITQREMCDEMYASDGKERGGEVCEGGNDDKLSGSAGIAQWEMCDKVYTADGKERGGEVCDRKDHRKDTKVYGGAGVG